MKDSELSGFPGGRGGAEEERGSIRPISLVRPAPWQASPLLSALINSGELRPGLMAGPCPLGASAESVA